MDAISITAFKGRIPRLAAKLLPEGHAQVATNCDLSQGKLQAMKGFSTVKSIPAGTRTLIRLSRDAAVSSDAAWVTAGIAGDLVRAQIANGDNRLYATADGGGAAFPVQTNSTLWADYLAGGGTPWVRLGMVAPADALDISVVGDPDTGTTEIAMFTGCTTSGDKTIILPEAHDYTLEVGDLVEVTLDGDEPGDDAPIYNCVLESWGGDGLSLIVNQDLSANDNATVVVSRQSEASVTATVSYVYTRVAKWYSGGTVIQAEESAPSAPTPAIDILSGQAVVLSGFVAGSSNPVTHFRIYRLAAGTSGAEYQYLNEIEVSESEYNDDQATGDDDHELQEVQADVLETEGWIPPPDGLEGLTQFANGILIGFVGNKMYMSEPYVGYAWPDEYTMSFDHDIVALAVFNESILVLTHGYPYVVTGLDPQSMSQAILPYEQACVSKASVAVSNVGVIYATPDGLFMLSGHTGQLMTKKVYTKEQWAALGPENLISFVYDDQYFGFFYGTGAGIFLNFKEDPYVVDIDLSGASITTGFLDPEDDTLYLANGSSLVSWGTGSNLEYEWKSKIYRPGDAMNYACAAVVADGEVDFQLYADGEAKLSPAYTVEDDEMFRLPSGYRAREWEIEITGNQDVDSVVVARFSAALH